MMLQRGTQLPGCQRQQHLGSHGVSSRHHQRSIIAQRTAVGSAGALAPPAAASAGAAPQLRCSTARSVRLRVEAGKRAAAAAAVTAAAPASAGVLLQPDLAFSSGTYLMVPVYFVLAFWPRSRVAKAIVSSPLMPLLFAAAYAVLAWQAWQGGSLGLVQTVLHAAKPWPDASLLAAMFQDRTLAALAWLHLLMLDFLTARAVLLDGLRLLVPTAHSVLLCFMVGPLGLLSHLLTRAVVHWQRKDSPVTASSSMWG